MIAHIVQVGVITILIIAFVGQIISDTKKNFLKK